MEIADESLLCTKPLATYEAAWLPLKPILYNPAQAVGDKIEQNLNNIEE